MENMTEVQSNGAVSLFRWAMDGSKCLLSFIFDDMMSRGVCEIKHANDLVSLSPRVVMFPNQTAIPILQHQF